MRTVNFRYLEAVVVQDSSPTARALMALESIQDSPGISAERLSGRLGVSDRAVRRYVGILREAGIPIDSAPGRYGGYRVGRGFRLPPLMFSTAEALGLVMAVLEARRGGSDADDPAGHALSKIIRVLPAIVAEPAASIRRVSTRTRDEQFPIPDPETTGALVQASASHRRLRLNYQLAPRRQRTMEVDPWAVSIRRGRWYLLCWSHTSDARRVLRIDKVVGVDVLPETFTPPGDLDPVRTIEEHLSEGWKYKVEVIVDAPEVNVAWWIRRSLGRLEAIDAGHTRLLGSTDEPLWYAQQLAAIEAPFRIVRPPEVIEATQLLGRQLLRASGQSGGAAAAVESD
ncbi:MAG: helix-turn-helix transcriptional regulator [Nakamurella sp.]